jgi:HK97 family phage portal protein
VNLLQRASSRLKNLVFPRVGRGSSGAGNGWLSKLVNLMSGDGYDYETRAGDVWKASSVASTTKALLRMLTDAEICVQKRAPKSKGGQWEIDHEHPLVEVFEGNPHFDSTQLLDAIAITYVFDGNSYLWKQRSLARRPVALWFINHLQAGVTFEPIRPEDGSSFVSHYEYSVNGVTYEIPVEDVIHIKNGVDPENDLLGWSDLKAELRNICTENEAANYTNAMLHNCGIPNVVITPADDSTGFSDEEGELLRDTFKQKFGGSRRGEPWVQNVALKVEVLGFDPRQMDLSFLRKIAQSGIAAAIGIPAVVVGLLVGLETSSAKASYEESLWQAYVACVLPMLKRIARQLSKALVSDVYAPFGDRKKLRVHFDLSSVACLGEDQDNLATRIVELFDAGVIKRSQAQAAMSYPIDEAADGYIYELNPGHSRKPNGRPSGDAKAQKEEKN